MLHSTKLLYVSSCICLLRVCKLLLDLIERFLLYVYLTEHPEIQDGCRYLGNARPPKKIVCIFIIFYAKYNKNKMALISIGIQIFLDQCPHPYNCNLLNFDSAKYSLCIRAYDFSQKISVRICLLVFEENIC